MPTQNVSLRRGHRTRPGTRAQQRHQSTHRTERLQAVYCFNSLLNLHLRQHACGIVTEFLLHLRPRQRILERAQRMLAMGEARRVIGQNKLNLGLRAAERRIGLNINFLRGESTQCLVVVARRRELRQGQGAVVHDCRGGVMR